MTPSSPAPRPDALHGAGAAAAGAAAGTTGDPHLDRYAARTTGMTASEIRALFAVASRPEVVSLAGGMPNLAALPLDSLAVEVGDLVATEGQGALQYGSAQGVPVLREQIGEVMAFEAGSLAATGGFAPDDVVVTVGSQSALDMLTRLFVDPGDVVLAESPSYVGALGSFAAYQAEVRHVAMDDDGLVPAALEEALERLAREGRRAKFLYTVPNFHNPVGVSLAPGRRAQVVELCRRYGVLIVEDNPYGLLGFDGQTYESLRSLDPENVVYLGSFSKIFASGLRVGWALAPHGIRDKLVLAAESATLCPPAFTQLVVSRYLATHDWRSLVKSFREMYRERCEAMLGALETHLPEGCSWTRPRGGFFVWATVPEGVDTRAMLPRAISARVAYASGTGFHADGSGARHMRLSFCYPPPERIVEGVRRLAGVLDGELEVLRTFGLSGSGATGARPSSGTPGPQAPSVDTA
ncbi:PLP-dependent aminotransferase family protein [Actinomycetospora corticicola]|uniref:DNA-binding transcriptional MocR family regulator n=1 Tax=Actinomycetospora corticicola TaxID=663602 RepID=A0A7Y9DZF1_9PSEU|nr:PLP-dependent aminotransferase family protein [Actinomycetospora corticicola]NYD38309.1 DNA-binding transcriptional MocR family regulator [Actinomycetospora corticicola]